MRPFNLFSSDIQVYELSFPCPRGLSGAPITTNTHDPQIAGVVVGNHSTKMLIFTDSERLQEGTETIVERYEALQLGIAIPNVQLFDIKSQLLKGTIGNHLNKCSLLGDRTL